MINSLKEFLDSYETDKCRVKVVDVLTEYNNSHKRKYQSSKSIGKDLRLLGYELKNNNGLHIDNFYDKKDESSRIGEESSVSKSRTEESVMKPLKEKFKVSVIDEESDDSDEEIDVVIEYHQQMIDRLIESNDGLVEENTILKNEILNLYGILKDYGKLCNSVNRLLGHSANSEEVIGMTSEFEELLEEGEDESGY